MVSLILAIWEAFFASIRNMERKILMKGSIGNKDLTRYKAKK